MHPRSGADGAVKYSTADTVRGFHCAWGGPEEKLKAASPRDEVLGPFDARLETCASRIGVRSVQQTIRVSAPQATWNALYVREVQLPQSRFKCSL